MIPVSANIRFPAKMSELPAILNWIRREIEKAGFPPRRAMQVELAVEEAVVNVLHYAYAGLPEEPTGEAELQTRRESEAFVFELSDRGRPFDPTEKKPAEANLDWQNAPIGGKGILLIGRFVDELHYERRGDQNILTMRIMIEDRGS